MINRKISLTVAGGSSYQFSVPFTLFISVAISKVASLKKLLVTEFIILIAPEVLPIAIGIADNPGSPEEVSRNLLISSLNS